MHGGEILIPILVPIAFCALIFGIFYIKGRENLAMIEKGMNPKDNVNRPAPFRSLKNGLLLLGAGLGLLVAFFLDIYAIPYSYEPVGLYFALIAVGGGIGLVISYMVEKKHWLNKSNGD